MKFVPRFSRKQKLLAVAALPLASSVFAAAPDTTAVTAAIGDAGTAGAAIGAAVLIMIVAIKLYKWVKGAM